MMPLPHRQKQVIDLLVAGLRDKEIAETLGVSEVTVAKHIRTVVKKYKARTRIHAVTFYNMQQFKKGKEETMINETAQEVESIKNTITAECDNLTQITQNELDQARAQNLTETQISELEARLKKVKAANGMTLSDIEVRLIQARDREAKEQLERNAEMLARSASEKAVMKAQLQGAWLREGGSLNDFKLAWNDIYKAEMIKRTMARSSVDEKNATQAIRNSMR